MTLLKIYLDSKRDKVYPIFEERNCWFVLTVLPDALVQLEYRHDIAVVSKKEEAMASVRNIANMRSYCDVMFDELTGMKSRLLNLIETIDKMRGSDKKIVSRAHDHGTHDHISHLRDIVNTIDWKLEILTKVCPADWMKYAAGAESASVKVPEKFEDVAFGDFGG